MHPCMHPCIHACTLSLEISNVDYCHHTALQLIGLVVGKKFSPEFFNFNFLQITSMMFGRQIKLTSEN